MRKYIIAILVAAVAVLPAMSQKQVVVAAPVDPAVALAMAKRIEANMVTVKGGSFIMGATQEQVKHAYDWEKPAHNVTVGDFKLGRYEVTQEEWEAIMGTNPSMFKGKNLPVESVSWNDCQVFIEKLNELTGRKFRLPTEAEWEYAARGGAKAKGLKFAGSDIVCDVAWYFHNSGKKTHEVGQLAANELGIYDMSGNVGEWCSDFCDVVHGYAPTSTKLTQRARRGGNWNSIAAFCRNSYRYGRKPDFRNETLGLRLAM